MIIRMSQISQSFIGNGNFAGMNFMRQWFVASTCVVIWTLCSCTCPRDPETAANACMESFSIQYHNMISSKSQLFTGIDVEALRLFCTAYRRSVSCVADVRQKCASATHEVINRALINLSGSQQALRDLCHDDQIYEQYAVSMTCFDKERLTSLNCFKRYMNITVRLLTSYPGSVKYLCRDMDRVVRCIKGNIRKRCGSQAASLTEKLVQPMVRRSTECYITDLRQTKAPPLRNSQVKYERPVKRSRHRNSATTSLVLPSSPIAIVTLMYLSLP